MSDSPRQPELENVLSVMIEAVLEEINVSMPGRIVSYNAENQSASVQPLIRKAHLDENGKRVTPMLPEIHDVPVRFIGSQATGRITVPVGVGDYGLLVFSSLSIARWKLTGGVVDPGDDHRHDINDCIFEPGLHDLKHPPTIAPTDAIVTHGPTRLGSPDADKAVTRTDDVQSALVGALTEATILDAAFTYGSTPPGPGKVAALAAVVTAVANYFIAHPVTGAEKVTAK